MQKTKMNTKKLAMLAVLCAAAYVVMVAWRIPVVLFLKYEAKDVIIAIGGFLFGPLSALLISAVVALLEMVTVSDTGIIGCVMNLLSSCSFACTAAFIYKKNRTFAGAVIGLAVGVAVMATVMLLWNYLITPLYMKVPREEVVKLLIPAFLPFNLLKGGLNGAITLVAYKPIVRALRRARLLETSPFEKKSGVGVWILSAVILLTMILLLLVFKGII